ncbi:hypothetical protein BASA83_010645 [Batrachochytrium salamandrivorans]|nr:hypothetical protein BASA83_010645 [Batrachochytrium salamandrivorans]
MLPSDPQFYHGLSSEIKDALVHFDNPSSVSAAMDLAIRIDNRLFERRQEQRLYHQRSSFSHSSATPITSRFRHQQQQQRIFESKRTANQTRSDFFINLPSARPTPKSNNHMNIDFVRRGPTIFYGTRTSDETRTLSCLWRNWPSKSNLPKVPIQAQIRFIQEYPRHPDRIHETTKLREVDSTFFKETVKFSQTIF